MGAKLNPTNDHAKMTMGKQGESCLQASESYLSILNLGLNLIPPLISSMAAQNYLLLSMRRSEGTVSLPNAGPPTCLGTLLQQAATMEIILPALPGIASLRGLK